MNASRVRFLLLASLFLLLTPYAPLIAQTKGNVIVTMMDAGGNAAPYGLVSVSGPENRRQSITCPRASLGSLPTGRVQCVSDYGFPHEESWQPFDILTARIVEESSTEIPADIRPSDSAFCHWRFEGFTGACSGMGTVDPTVTNRRVYECQFVLPDGGDVNLGVKVSAFDSLNRPCPIVSSENFPTEPTPTPTAAPTNTPFPPAGGSAIAELLNRVTQTVLDGMRDQNIRRAIRKAIVVQMTPTPRKLSVRVTGSSATSSAKLSAAKKNGGRCPNVVARGKITTSTTKNKSLKVRFTKKGKRCLRKKSEADLVFSFSVAEVGDVSTQMSNDIPVQVRSKLVTIPN